MARLLKSPKLDVDLAELYSTPQEKKEPKWQFPQGWKAAVRKFIIEVSNSLVTGVSKKDPGEFQARTENNKVVIFSCDDQNLIGNFVPVEIVEAKTKSLRGV